MEIVSLGPLRTASLLWRSRGGAWAQAVICKATFLLRPTTSALAEAQEHPNEEDSYWNDDPTRSLFSPSDLVPFKTRADVVLVGSAFAPRGEQVRSLVVRVQIGELDKSIEVWSDRTWTQDGQLVEGPRFSRMPLRYERAAGGPGTRNPVGVRHDGPPDPYGRRGIPNLQPPGLVLADPADVLPPIGFGPIAPSWPERQSRLGALAGRWPSPGWTERPIPDGLDPRYFNVAPLDQHIDAIHANERIVLENLHPDHPRLVTSLPGIAPTARIARAGGAPAPIEMRADTLWIDTDRGVCTVVWRAQIQLAARDEPGAVMIGLLQPQPAGGDADPLTMVLSPHAGSPDAPVTELGPEDLQDASVTGTLAPDLSRAGRPDVLPFRAASPPEPAPEPRAVPLPPPPPLVRLAPNPEPIAPAPKQSPWAASPDVRVPAPTVGMSAVAAAAASTNEPAPQVDKASVLGVSNAAAQADAWPSARPAQPAEPRPREGAKPEERPAPRRETIVKLLWSEPDLVAKLRQNLPWRRILLELDLMPVEDSEAAAALDEEPSEVQDRRRVHEVLARGAPLSGDGLRQAFDGAFDGKARFEPPLVLVAGELELPFDENEILKATLTAVAPFAGSDKKLKETVDTANELLRTPWLQSSGGIAESMTERVKEAFAQTRRGLPADYLENHTERMLLQERRYQRRSVYGQPSLRGILQLAGAPAPIPTYLPDRIANELPMFRRFRARMLAHVDLREDQYETCPMALRGLALGRVIDR